MLGKRLLHGGDYNPEQWLEYPEVLEEDLRLMKEAGVNCVTLGVFSWAMLEPREGEYDFDWLEERIDRLGKEEIQVILATPSGAMPHWLTQKYPEVMQVQADGRRNLPGKRHNFCYTSPVMRRKIRSLDERLSQRFGSKENVILWHISNELGGNFSDGACHCPLCQEAFRIWLKEKYGTLEQLNHAWWGRFWSHVYTDWNQIHSPAPNGEWTMTGLTLDWKRFVTWQMSSFCREEIEAVRSASSLPVTTNLMGFFKNLDYSRLKNQFDLISWDCYPYWHRSRDEVPEAVWAAAGHSMMRSMKKAPFLLMESVPSAVNWREYNPLKRPGMHMLSSLQAVAHGADSVLYFQWRKGRGAYEKFHGAVIDHLNGRETRTFREVAEVGAALPRLEPYLEGTVNRPKAAIVFDWENWWALEDTTGPRLDLDYPACIVDHFRAFWEAGIEADIIGMEDSLAGYQLVSAPLNYMYRGDYGDRVRQFVEEGGIYVTTCFSGCVDESDLCFTGHHPLEDVLGLVPEEIDASSEDFANSFIYGEKEYPAQRLCAVVHPKPGARVLAAYEKDFYAGSPAVLENTRGKGMAYFLAAISNLDFLRAFYRDVFRQAGLTNALGIDLPYGVTVTERLLQEENDNAGMGGDAGMGGKAGMRGKAGEGQSLVFVMNFRHDPAELSGIGQWRDVLSGQVFQDVLPMDKLSCRVLERVTAQYC